MQADESVGIRSCARESPRVVGPQEGTWAEEGAGNLMRRWETTILRPGWAGGRLALQLKVAGCGEGRGQAARGAAGGPQNRTLRPKRPRKGACRCCCGMAGPASRQHDSRQGYSAGAGGRIGIRESGDNVGQEMGGPAGHRVGCGSVDEREQARKPRKGAKPRAHSAEKI